MKEPSNPDDIVSISAVPKIFFQITFSHPFIHDKNEPLRSI